MSTHKGSGIITLRKLMRANERLGKSLKIAAIKWERYANYDLYERFKASLEKELNG
jgi:hypothetical protein